MKYIYCQLRARRALSIFKDVPLRTRRGLSLYNVYGNSTLLVFNGTSLKKKASFWLLTDDIFGKERGRENKSNIDNRKGERLTVMRN